MFKSDKDLRKPVAKKVVSARPQRVVGQAGIASALPTDNGTVFRSPSAAISTLTSTDAGTNDILEKAKQEREQRALIRERSVIVLRLQKWWRGRSAARNYYQNIAHEISLKLQDVEKITALLAQKGADFVTPPPIALALVCQFVVMSRYAARHCCSLVDKLGALVINPSVAELDCSKNLVAHQRLNDPSMRMLCAFFCALMRLLVQGTNGVSKHNKMAKVSSPVKLIDAASIATTLQLLTGMNAPFKMKYAPELEAAFLALRQSLWTSCSLLQRVREYFLLRCDPLLSVTNSGDSSGAPQMSLSIAAAAKGSSVNYEIGALFAITLFHVEAASASASLFRTHLRAFACEILTVPMLTLLLPAASLEVFCRWKSLPELFSLLSEPNDLPLPEKSTTGHTCLRVISSGQWLLGNLAALSASILASPGLQPTSPGNSPTAPSGKPSLTSGLTVTEISDPGRNECLLPYLSLCATWIAAYGIPDILQGRRGIVWQRQGTNSTAVAVPAGLEEQILNLLHPRVLTALTAIILQPIPTPGEASCGYPGSGEKGLASPGLPTDSSDLAAWASQYGLKADIEDVTQALASSAYVVTHKTLTDHQEASTWFTAKWAKKIASNITGGFSLPSFSVFSGSSSSGNSSSAGASSSSSGSKASAGTKVGPGASADASQQNLSQVQSGAVLQPALVFALCRLWAILLSSAANSQPDSPPWKALSQLAFSGSIVPKLWCFVLERVDLDKLAAGFGIAAAGLESYSKKTGGGGGGASSSSGAAGAMADHVAVLQCLVCVLRMVLIVLDDTEVYDSGKPLPLHQFLRLIRCLKVVLFKALQDDPELFADVKFGSETDGKARDGDLEIWTGIAATQRRVMCHSMRMVGIVLADLYSRWARRPFSSATLWEVKETSSSAMRAEFQQLTPLATTLLRVMPWCVDFHERMRLFRAALDAERLQIQGSNDLLSGGPQRSRGVLVRIRKSRVLEDGMEAIGKVGAGIKDRVIVKYINEFGEEEAGIDAGGLFKDFVTDLSGRIFDPSYGLFCCTASNLLYPNPSAPMLFDAHEMDTTYVFLGRVLGKAMFENITLQPQFAHFFLAFMHGKYNYMNLINDLHTLDPELYRNLMFLKTYEGDIADLGLTFAVTDTSMGGQREVELLPGGAAMDVTSQNRHRYINLAAKYYLHDRLKRQAKAFFSGLHQVVSPELLGMFCAPELQILISGSQAGLSVDDLKQHTRYAGGYLALDRHILRFWSVFTELSAEDQALLLKFVTSCERPPSLGFVSLQPPFTIQRVDCSDDQRLPTASTCFNILKLPTYSSAKVMKEKLLQSIRSKAGFDLS